MNSDTGTRSNHSMGFLLSVAAVVAAVASLYRLNEPANFFFLSSAALAISMFLMAYAVKNRGLATGRRHFFTVGATVAILMVLAAMLKFSITR